MPITFIDLFCGIGGFHRAFSRPGVECVFANDYDIHYNICELVYKWSNADDEATCYKIFEELLRILNPG